MSTDGVALTTCQHMLYCSVREECDVSALCSPRDICCSTEWRAAQRSRCPSTHLPERWTNLSHFGAEREGRREGTALLAPSEARTANTGNKERRLNIKSPSFFQGACYRCVRNGNENQQKRLTSIGHERRNNPPPTSSNTPPSPTSKMKEECRPRSSCCVSGRAAVPPAVGLTQMGSQPKSLTARTGVTWKLCFGRSSSPNKLTCCVGTGWRSREEMRWLVCQLLQNVP